MTAVRKNFQCLCFHCYDRTAGNSCIVFVFFQKFPIDADIAEMTEAGCVILTAFDDDRDILPGIPGPCRMTAVCDSVGDLGRLPSGTISSLSSACTANVTPNSERIMHSTSMIRTV